MDRQQAFTDAEVLLSGTAGLVVGGTAGVFIGVGITLIAIAGGVSWLIQDFGKRLTEEA